MKRYKHPTVAFKVAIVVMATISTFITPTAAHLIETSADLPPDVRLVGTLHRGETSAEIAYRPPPNSRAFSFEGKKGDVAEVWVRSHDGGDAVVFLYDAQFKRLTSNDDADNTTTDAYIKLTLPGNLNPDISTYYVVFRDYNHANAHFTVSLQGSGAVNWPSLSGRWKDDLNRQLIEITVAPGPGNSNQEKIIAKYATNGKNCRNPDGQGNPVSFQIDFEGEYSNGEVTGVIYWCTTQSDKGRTITTGLGKGPIHLQEGDDGITLRGNFKGANGTEAISFTRIQPR